MGLAQHLCALCQLVVAKQRRLGRQAVRLASTTAAPWELRSIRATRNPLEARQFKRNNDSGAWDTVRWKYGNSLSPMRSHLALIVSK